ncbi:GerMN domain-containing protein [Actinocrispum wychmicini]|uniref:GerMN domain-containing protein n=1 Tax=Actinocrispum wychmicini TaxID=1213861 RepID=UPI00104E87D5|nr:GerMN domain-containing protein [Actinocrispum wychmicini]
MLIEDNSAGSGLANARLHGGTLVLVCVLLLAGCGVRPSGTPAPRGQAEGIVLYLVHNGKLTPVVRTGTRPPIGDLVTLLAAGPLPEEEGYTTEVPQGTKLLSTGQPPPELTLSVDVAALSDNAVDQILCTAGYRSRGVILIGQGQSRGPHRCTVE